MPRAKRKDRGSGEAAFQFVNATASPTAAKNRAETRALVRANATKYQWKHSRSPSQPLAAAVTKLEDVIVSPSGDRRGPPSPSFAGGSPQPHSRDPSASAAKIQQQPIRIEAVDQRQSSQETREEVVWYDNDGSAFADGNEDEDVPIVGTTPSQSLVLCQGIQLRQGFPTSFTPNNTGRLLDFNFQIIIPSLLPTVEGGREHPAARDWVQRASQSRALFLIWMHGAAVDTRVPQDAREALGSVAVRRNYVQVLEQLNEEMKDPQRACQDENILTVSGMTSYPIDGPVLKHVSSPNQAGMKSLQGLDLHSTFRSVPEHARGLEMLIEMRGGLHNLKMEALGAIISYYWTFQASRELITPRVPFVSLLPDTPSSHTTEVAVPPHNHPLRALGTGFLFYWKAPTSQLIHDLVAVIRLICHYTMIIDDHQEGRILQTNLAKLADQRNMTQHRLMSLPPLPQDPDHHWDDDLYEVCRLATMIYSLLVVFPILPTTAPFGELARRLKLQLSYIDLDNISPRAENVILWVLIIGGVAAIYHPERLWYASTLTRFSVQKHFNTWDDIREILKSFLWLPSTSDIDGIALWSEVTQRIQLNSAQPEIDIDVGW